MKKDENTFSVKPFNEIKLNNLVIVELQVDNVPKQNLRNCNFCSLKKMNYVFPYT